MNFYLLLAFLHTASALDVSFHLVAFAKSPPTVSINGADSVTLETYAAHPSAPYYVKNLTGLPDSFTYKYTVDGVTETFERSLNSPATTTHNDFFGRKDTVLKIPALPQAFPGQTWDRGWGHTPLFDDSYVPTLWLEGDDDQVNAVLSGKSKSANLTVFGVFKDDVFSLANTEWKTADANQINYAKKEYGIKFAKKADIYGREELTLTPAVEDPTMLREKIYADLLGACGLPSTRMVHARVYVNKIPLGLYLLADSADTDSFIKAEFHGQIAYKNYAAIGTLIKPYNTFTFIYNGDARADYPEVAVKYLGSNPVSNPVKSLLDNVLEPLAFIQPGSEDGVQKSLEVTLDLDRFLKTVALEWLAGHWKGVWGEAKKFILYEDPVLTQSNWLYVSNNAEKTFGLGLTSDVIKRTIITQKYTDYQTGMPRPLIQKVLLAKKYGDRFANILTEIVKTTFNPAALKMRIDGTVARIRWEVEWDRSLTRPTAGLADLYEIADLDWGLTATTERLGVNGTTGVGWGIESWVSQRAGVVSSSFGFELPQTVTAGPDPEVTAPTKEQKKGATGKTSSSAGDRLRGVESAVAVLFLLVVTLSVTGEW